MNRTPRVTIIGGGIAGLAAALALHRRGIEVAIYEQAGALSEIGAGVQMTPNAMKALRALGIEEAAMAVAFEPEGQMLRSWKSGRVIYRAPVRRVFRENFGHRCARSTAPISCRCWRRRCRPLRSIWAPAASPSSPARGTLLPASPTAAR